MRVQGWRVVRAVADRVSVVFFVSCVRGPEWSSSLTIIEKVIGFMIDMYRSLLMCTIEFVVRGSLAVLIGAVEMVSHRAHKLWFRGL